jgi:hypothetical protein
MVVSTPQRRTIRQRGRRLAFRLDLEALETRALPSATSWPGLVNPVTETEPNDTLDQSQNLGDLTVTPRAEVIGTISNGSASGGVDWYSFQLDRAANVSLTTPKAQADSSPVTTLSLYNTDLYDANDPYNVLGYRLLDQADSAAQGGVATIERRLAPGTYYVAVSGSGNHYFNPFLAGSGYAGAAGDYGLLITAADLGLTASDGPVVLAADPRPGASLGRSPFMIRVDVSEPLDPSTLSPGGSVQLISNANGTFGDGNDQVVNLANVSLTTDGTELMIAPAAPLGPGYYKVVLLGDATANPSQVLADLNGLSLGTSASHLSGADASFVFQVNGNEGLPASPSGHVVADDSAATSHELGDLTQSGFAQIAGAIGTDSTDPTPFDGSNVDVYHFKVSGSGRYAFTAEVFAGRIGSPLTPGVSLFQADPTTGQLTLLGSNTGTHNAVTGTNGTVPLYTDPLLYAGLEAGDYYVAISNNFNVPDPATSPAATNGVFDPHASLTGQNGGPTGDYVLNLQVQPGPDSPPQVVAVTPTEGATVDTAPTSLTVQFSGAVDLLQLAQTPANGVVNTLAAVYVQGSGGTKYYPRLVSFDAATNQATFLMLNGLANDTYEFHLSGALGLTDFAGNPLVGNDPSGDYVVHFTVNGPARGTGTNPLLWSDTEPNDDLAHPQDLGVLFGLELQSGVTLERDFTQNVTSAPADTADYYQFQVLEMKSYFFNFASASLPAGAEATLFDATGTPVLIARQPGSAGFSANLQPGTYILKIGDWATSDAASVTYSLVIDLGSNPDHFVPLTAGPAPAINIQLVAPTPSSPPITQLVVTPPPVTPPTVVSTPPTSNPPPVGSPPSGPANAPPANSPSTPPAPTVVVVTTPPVAPAPTVPADPAPVVTPPVPNVVTNSPTPTPSTGSPPVTIEVPTSAAPLAPAVTSVPSGSGTVLINVVAPAGPTNTGIAPALLRTISDRPAETVSLPTGVLLALGAAPVGGIKDSTFVDSAPPADRVVLVRLPVDRLAQPGTVSISRIDSGTSAVDAAGAALRRLDLAGPSVVKVFQRTLATSQSQRLTTLFSQGLRQLASYASTLDVLFGMAQWLEDPTLVSPKTPSPFEDQPAQDESADFESLSSETTQMPNLTDRVLVNGLAALATLAVAKPERKQRSQAKGRRLAVRGPKTEID